MSFRNYKGFINKFIDILVFDAIIGNQDRHSENWAIIRSLDVEHLEGNLRKLYRYLYKLYKRQGLKFKDIPFKNYFLRYMNKAELVDIKFSPIYDSGSSLGRDIHESKIQLFLDDDSKVQKYINKGLSEIRWNSSDKKINHFDILIKVKEKYPQYVSESIQKVIKKYKKGEIETIIKHIDKSLASDIEETELSLPRKELIIKFIDFRIQRLKQLL